MPPAAAAVHLGGYFFISLVFSCSSARCADRLVLRDLTVVDDRSVASVDEDGLLLDDGELITWDRVERAAVGEEMQPEVDRLFGELADPLFRIRVRLRVGDYESISAPAEALYRRFAARKGASAYMVCQAVMWSRLKSGRAEAALEPYLRCYEMLRAGVSPELPGERRLDYDAETAITPEMPPVWLDAEAARQALADVQSAVSAMQPPLPDGARLYFGGLAIAAGKQEQGLKILSEAAGASRATRELRDLATAHAEVLAGRFGLALRNLEKSLDELAPQNRPAARYWLGLAKTGQQETRVRRLGVLHLLHLPALYGRSHPDLAAAGLYQSIAVLDELGAEPESLALREELMVRYPQSKQAAQVRAAITENESP